MNHHNKIYSVLIALGVLAIVGLINNVKQYGLVVVDLISILFFVAVIILAIYRIN